MNTRSSIEFWFLAFGYVECVACFCLESETCGRRYLQLNVYIQFDTCIRPLKSDIRLELFV